MGTWKLDPFHTQVEFSAKHLGMMTVRGHFAEVAASGDIHPEAPEQSTVEATINTASIRTHNEQRDNDLRSSNFLEWTSTRRSPSRARRSSPRGRIATT
jgi:polyisoprenoid-binding protein YceI